MPTTDSTLTVADLTNPGVLVMQSSELLCIAVL